MDNKIYVTKASLPNLQDFASRLQTAWDTGILTHHGPLVQEFEAELKALYNVEHLTVVTNGTIAIQLAIRALDLKGEIITTPFSWIATCSSIMWENCIPVFVDIDDETFNIDPSKIENAITDKTSAILGVHVFSNPCDVEAIQKIADKHHLKVIYDGAHASHVNYKGKSIFLYGDVSTVSFHATKLLNSGEGGACISPSKELDERIKRMRFFGHNDQKDIVDYGCNGKMTEIHAALGLVNIPLVSKVLSHRRMIYDIYTKLLGNCSKLRFQKIDPQSYNFSYMPLVFETEELLLKCEKALIAENIFPRRYFYPSLNTIPLLGNQIAMPKSESLSERILCLPSHNEITEEHVNKISAIILKHAH